jgi:mannose-6-phosphate isomerase
MLPPLVFQPIFKPRVWGGRMLETLYGKPLPPDEPIGESWEITDRPEGVSEVAAGPLAGRTLRELMEQHRAGLLGEAADCGGRFPLLVKLLDARQMLSLQVHPPARRAAELGGEPKTEMWYVAHAEPDAELMAGVRPGVTRERFAQMLRDGTAAEAVPRLRVQVGDALFLPSGRLHALGAGLVVFEIQQNSDTTYRVFDWNRVGTDGRPRELHIEPALASIDFSDTEPALIPRRFEIAGPLEKRLLVDDPLFRVEQWRMISRDPIPLGGARRPLVLAVLEGRCQINHPPTATTLSLTPGAFCLLPAVTREHGQLVGARGAGCLVAEPGSSAAR